MTVYHQKPGFGDLFNISLWTLWRVEVYVESLRFHWDFMKLFSFMFRRWG